MRQDATAPYLTQGNLLLMQADIILLNTLVLLCYDIGQIDRVLILPLTLLLIPD